MADVTQFLFGEANQDKSGVFTRDTALATGTQAITGVGFTPQAIVFFSTESYAAGEASWGLDDGTSHVIYDNFNDAANSYKPSLSYSIFDNEGGGKSYVGIANSFDSDGFTIGWTKNDLPTGTFTVNYLAYK